MAKKSKEFNLEEFLKEESTGVEDSDFLPEKYITLKEIVQQAIGVQGIPLGHISMGYGLSDSGKTEFMLHIAKAAVEQGVLPIFIITENKFKEERLEKFGIYNKKNAIIKRDIRYLEDVYNYMSQIIHRVKAGEIKKDIIFLWDSVASTPSSESFEISKDGSITKRFGPQKNASVIGYYNPLMLDMISNTRHKDSEHQVGLYMVNQAYITPSKMPGLPATLTANGGEKIWYNLSLTLEFSEGQRLKAKVGGLDYTFGLVTRIKTVKNHINGLYGTSKLVLVDGDILENDKASIDEYKKDNKDKWQFFEAVELEEDIEE
jgi:RecA/RadA recombinase